MFSSNYVLGDTSFVTTRAVSLCLVDRGHIQVRKLQQCPNSIQSDPNKFQTQLQRGRKGERRAEGGKSKSCIKSFMPGFGNGLPKYCATVQFWGGQRNILRAILETQQACFFTTIYLREARGYLVHYEFGGLTSSATSSANVGRSGSGGVDRACSVLDALVEVPGGNCIKIGLPKKSIL